jgi:hypothetical protein
MATMTTKKTTGRNAGWHVSNNPSSKALPAGQRVTEQQHGIDRGRKSDASGAQKNAGIKPNGKLAGRPETPAVTTRTEAPMSPMGKAAKRLYPSAK